MLKQIYIKTSFRGIHSYWNLKKILEEDPSSELRKVDHLINSHRHTFNVKIYFEINHNDRDLEFFIMQGKV